MPVIYHCAQNSEEWYSRRLGIPTASEFARIVTPTGKKSDQADAYMNRLIAEWALGTQLEDGVETQWMQHGHELEALAMRSYAFEMDAEPEEVGFITTDDGLIGASPDRLVGESGLLELKCPAPQTHIYYMRTRKLSLKYKPQTQGQLLVSGREWVDLQSFHPGLPTVIIRQHRDEEYITLLDAELRAFVDRLLEARAELEREYGNFRKHLQPPAPAPLEPSLCP
jgi:hypothetical protein